MTPADLISEKSCTAICMTAATRRHKCRCVCAGEHHGLLSGADITALMETRRGWIRPNPIEGR